MPASSSDLALFANAASSFARASSGSSACKVTFPESAPFQFFATDTSISRMNSGSSEALFTLSPVALATIAPAISDLIFETACRPASAISVNVFFSTSSAFVRAARTMPSACACASARIFCASALASEISFPASARPFSKPSS